MSYHDTIQRVSTTDLYACALVIQAHPDNTSPIWVGSDQNMDATTPTDPTFTGISLSKGDMFKLISADQSRLFNLKYFYIQYSVAAKVNILYWSWDGQTYPALQRSDAFAYDQAVNNWVTTNGIPTGYSMITQPTLAIDIMPPPSDTGALQCIYTQIGSDLSNTGVELSSIPEDFCLYVKWGTLYRMLSEDGPARDLQRAAYCKQRFDEGVELARLLSGDYYA